MSPFKDRVIQIIRMIPHGKVASYGQVALYAGLPRAAREVGWILNGSEGRVELPWWRVISKSGLITISGTKYNDRETQKKLLLAEGVSVADDYIVPMDEFRWLINSEQAKQLQLSQAYLETIIRKKGM